MSTKLEEAYAQSPFSGSNANYVESLYETWLKHPDQVSESWQATFKRWSDERDRQHPPHSTVLESFRDLRPAVGVTGTTQADCDTAEKQAAVLRLINGYRFRGHQAATLDPLNLHETWRPEDLDPAFHGLSEADMDKEFSVGSFMGAERMTLRALIQTLERIYCHHIGYEYMHITNTEEKRWIQERIESNLGHFNLTVEQRKRLLEKLTAAEGLEKYLHTKYVGQKRFSLEGCDSLIPLLHELLQHEGENGIRELVLGMAHRGRLNVLVNILGKSPKLLFDEFEGKTLSVDDPAHSGDVKYHMGFSSDIRTPGGNLHVALAFNPSHLEIVNPVVAGSTKARIIRRKDFERKETMAVLIHGDAAFAGQGVVMELFNMSQARGFHIGGTLHIIVNNQIGFTTSNPLDSRSTLYSTEVAKMVQAPIFHVNADDPEAVKFVTELAADFRRTFKKDVVIDLIGYRRHGHNEADEPAATQPMMYQAIRKHPTPRQIYGEYLESMGLVSLKEQEEIIARYRQALDEGNPVAEIVEDAPKPRSAVDWSPYLQDVDGPGPEVDTGVPVAVCQELGLKLTEIPENFRLHNRVARIIKDRVRMARGEIPMDWGFAETLAYATLLRDRFSVRLVGQDSERGTFFHRHAVLHNQDAPGTFTPLKQLEDGEHRFTVINSLLSEEAVLAFEYGYATADPRTLVIWEAQFGDFANGAQVVIDQFISSGEAKWGRLCGLTLFLPHGYEGQGPEHSSARVERYMQLCAQYNMQVCMPTTPAQMFHLLRRQTIRNYRKPLIVFTPKSLLRHKSAISTLEELANGRFQEVIADPGIQGPEQVERVVFCSGKVYYDLLEYRHQHNLENIAIVRVEQLYPFPREALQAIVDGFPNLREMAWCQEEPRNQGAWYQIKHHLFAIKPESAEFWYCGRRRSPSPAVGSYGIHVQQQEKLVREALTLGTGTMTANN